MLITSIVFFTLCIYKGTAYAAQISEGDIQNIIDASGKEDVAGNFFI